jgi:high affinity choline transporter 7
MATLVAIFVPIVYGLFVLAADIVFVLVLPQLFCAVFVKRTNVYGAIMGFLLGTVLRMGAGETFLDWQPLIEYPFYSVDSGQQFPFRTFAVIMSLVTIVLVSLLADFVGTHLFQKSKDVYTVSTPGDGITQTHSSSHPMSPLSN